MFTTISFLVEEPLDMYTDYIMCTSNISELNEQMSVSFTCEGISQILSINFGIEGNIFDKAGTTFRCIN
jgi:hypothetical protein